MWEWGRLAQLGIWFSESPAFPHTGGLACPPVPISPLLVTGPKPLRSLGPRTLLSSDNVLWASEFGTYWQTSLSSGEEETLKVSLYQALVCDSGVGVGQPRQDWRASNCCPAPYFQFLTSALLSPGTTILPSTLSCPRADL